MLAKRTSFTAWRAAENWGVTSMSQLRNFPRVEVVLLPEEILLVDSIRPLAKAVLLTRANLDLPGPTIISASQGFEQLSGYAEAELLGLSPRLLQGPLSERSTLERLRAACARAERFEGETVNYTRAGEPFLVHWCIDPIRGKDGSVTHFMAVQEDVTDSRAYARQWIAAETQRHSILGEASEQLAAIAEAILVLENTKRNFRSNQLAELRQRLLSVTKTKQPALASALRTSDAGR